MKSLSLKLKDEVFKQTEVLRHQFNKPRNAYINDAVEFFNILQKRKLLSEKLFKESKLVQKESLKVLREFEKLKDENQAV